MSYDAIRHFADSYGLGAMVIVYLILAFWAFRPGAHARNRAAATMIFAEDGDVAVSSREQTHG